MAKTSKNRKTDGKPRHQYRDLRSMSAGSPTHAGQNVLRNSTIASLSVRRQIGAIGSAPSWPRLLLPAHCPGTQTFSSWRFSGFCCARAQRRIGRRIASRSGKACPPVLRRSVGDEAEPPLVDQVVAAVEHLRAVLAPASSRSRIVGHRAVVQVGRAQPDAVERQVGVAVGLAEMPEALFRIGRRRDCPARPRGRGCSCRAGRGRCGSCAIGSTLPTRAPEKSRPLAPWQPRSTRRKAACPAPPTRHRSGTDIAAAGSRRERSQSAISVSDSRSSEGRGPRRCRRRRCGCAPRPVVVAVPVQPHAAAARGPCSHKGGKIDDADRLRAAAAVRTASSTAPSPARTCRTGPARASPRDRGSGSGSVPGSALPAWPEPRRIGRSRRSTKRILRAGALGGLHYLPGVEPLIERALRQELRKAAEIEPVAPASRRPRPGGSERGRDRCRRDRRRSSARCGRNRDCAASMSRPAGPSPPRRRSRAIASPRRAGSRGTIRGRALKIPAGMPASRSPPVEPYLNCLTGSSKNSSATSRE